MNMVNTIHQNATHVRMFGPDGSFEYNEITGRRSNLRDGYSVRIRTPRGDALLKTEECEALFGVTCWHLKVENQDRTVVLLYTTGRLDVQTLESHGSLVVLFTGNGNDEALKRCQGKVYRATLEVFP